MWDKGFFSLSQSLLLSTILEFLGTWADIWISKNVSCEKLFYFAKKFTFFHFGGNSLRRVHVFLRDQKKTYHPFFEPEMGV